MCVYLFLVSIYSAKSAMFLSIKTLKRKRENKSKSYNYNHEFHHTAIQEQPREP